MNALVTIEGPGADPLPNGVLGVAVTGLMESFMAGTAANVSVFTYDLRQTYVLFSVFNAPLFATFVVGMFWKRMTAAAGGPVYGMGGVDLKGDDIAGDAAWCRSPLLLGGLALALSIALYIPLWR